MMTVESFTRLDEYRSDVSLDEISGTYTKYDEIPSSETYGRVLATYRLRGWTVTHANSDLSVVGAVTNGRQGSILRRNRV